MKPLAAALLLLAAGALPAGTAHAAAEDPCAIPDSILTVDAALPRVQERIRNSRTLPVLVISSAKMAAGRTAASYPEQLGRELSNRLSGHKVTVSVRSAPGATTQEILPVMEAAMAQERPALVVWQVGTTDAMRNIGPDAFGTALASGIERAHAGGADIVVMDMQYSLQTSQLIALQPYVTYVEWVTQNAEVFHFPRYEMMRHWIDHGRVAVDAESPSEKLKAYSFVHGCVGRLLAETVTAMIDRAAEAPQ